MIAIGVLLWVAYKPPAKKPKKPNPMFRFFKQKALQKETQQKETQVKLRQSIKEGAAALEQMRKASNKTNLDKK